ncbi:WD40 repeat domain-containing protein [Streptomyces echinatus]|uniref:WD40 repeat domain-containing protein n=1 Tax=Streptomyces echinatus TaxID=67293 RepID=UPI0037A995D8
MKNERDSDSYRGALRTLGQSLTTLKRVRQAPSYARIRSRGVELLGDEWAISKPSMSEIFAGRRGPSSLDRLLWLVRALLSYQEGEEITPPGRQDPRLKPWREAWGSLEALRAARRGSAALMEDGDAQALASALETALLSALKLVVPPSSTSAETPASPISSAPSVEGLLPQSRDYRRSRTVAQLRALAEKGMASETLLTVLRSRAVLLARLNDGRGTLHRTVAFHPQGIAIATACSSIFSGGVSWLWDPITCQSLGEISGHEVGVSTVAFSPNGLRLATIENWGQVRLWDAMTLQCTGEADQGHHGNGIAAVYSPDSSLLVTAGIDGLMLFRNPVTGDVVGSQVNFLDGGYSAVTSMAFSPDGRLLATANAWSAYNRPGDVAVRLWRVTGRDPVTCELACDPLPGDEKGVNCVAFSRDGSLLASGHADGSVQLWRVEGLDPVICERANTPQASPNSAVRAVTFSQDGSLFASSRSNGLVMLWRVKGPDPAAWEPACEALLVPDDSADSLAFSPDATLLATGGKDLFLWMLPTSL